jgi:hypothetical protein
MLKVTKNAPTRLFFEGSTYKLNPGDGISGRLGAYLKEKGWAAESKPRKKGKKTPAPENKAEEPEENKQGELDL